MKLSGVECQLECGHRICINNVFAGHVSIQGRLSVDCEFDGLWRCSLVSPHCLGSSVDSCHSCRVRSILQSVFGLNTSSTTENLLRRSLDVVGSNRRQCETQIKMLSEWHSSALIGMDSRCDVRYRWILAKPYRGVLAKGKSSASHSAETSPLLEE